MKRPLESLPPLRWIAALAPLLVAIFYLPLAFGGTTPETVGFFDGLLVRSFLVWLCVLALERRLPRFPLALLVSVAVLVALGVCQWANPRSYFDADFWEFVELGSHIPGLPATVDRAASGEVLLHLGALLLGGIVLFDAMRSSRARWLLLRAFALSGFLIAAVGICQKASGAEAMLWTTPDRSGENFFGAFRYHANAASFLNLSWPAALAVWLRERLARPGSVLASLDFCVFFFTLASVFANTSKAGQILGFVGVGIALWMFRREFGPIATNRAGIAVLATVFVALFALLVLPAAVAIRGKWGELIEDGQSLEGRLLAYRACLGAIWDHPWFGSGAGTFRFVFPFHTLELEDRIQGFWYHAHQDYLQGIIEWGWVGFAAWAVLFAGALFYLVRRRLEATRQGNPEIAGGISALALGLVLVHALVDFPLQIPAIQWLVVLYLAIGWGVGSGPRRAASALESSQPAPAMRRKVRVRET